MSDRPGRPHRYTLTFSLYIEADLTSLDPDALGAAQAILDDLTYGRVTGKRLGERNVTGDLTGLARVKFDDPGHRPQRFRVVYREVDDSTLDIIAIGRRDEHAIYRIAVRRLTPRPENERGAAEDVVEWLRLHDSIIDELQSAVVTTAEAAGRAGTSRRQGRCGATRS